MTKDKGQSTKDNLIWLFFAALVIFVYFFGLNMPLVGPDEPRYAQVAREMFERGDWVTPTLGGATWFEKPALLYWLEIASFHLFGVTEFAARFGSALFGLGTIAALWILGKSVPSSEFQVPSEDTATNNEQRTTNNFANWLALVAASSIGLIVFSRGASFDIILTFPVTAALVSYFIFDLKNRGEDSGKIKFIALALFYFFIGVALIAKGLVGFVLPMGVVGFYHVFRLEILPSKTFIISLVWGTILSVLVAAVWYFPVYQANGWKFIDEFFIQHHFQRYTSNKYLHPQPFWFFWAIMPLLTIPWLPFFFISIWKKIKSQIANRKSQMPALSTFSAAWLLFPLVFFSFSGSKLPGYILPALPAAIILTAFAVYEFAQKSFRRKIAAFALAGGTFLFVIVALLFFADGFVRGETVKYMVETAGKAGYKNEKILNLHMTSHSIEFYGAGRLLRGEDGKQVRFYGVKDVAEQIEKDGERQALVLIPLEYLKYLTESDLVETEVLDNNGEVAICLVKLKDN